MPINIKQCRSEVDIYDCTGCCLTLTGLLLDMSVKYFNKQLHMACKDVSRAR